MTGRTDEDHGRPAGTNGLGEITEADRRAFAEVVREAYRVSADVEDEVEECLRLGREEPMPREDSLRLLEKIVGRFMDVGEWPETGRSAREEAERIEGGRPG